MRIRFNPKIYKVLILLGMLLAAFYEFDGSMVVMRNRLASVAIAAAAMFFRVEFEKTKHSWLAAAILGIASAGSAYLCCQLFLDLNIVVSPGKMFGTICFYLGVFP